MAPRKNLSGQTFGIYHVLAWNPEASAKTGRVIYTCECTNCGTQHEVRADNVKRAPKHCPVCKYPNLIGKTFGELIVLEKGSTDKNGHVSWVCQCSCGNLKEITGSNLIQGYTTSCGCVHKRITSNLNFEDLTGQQFGKLTVLKRTSEIGAPRIKWLCHCSCGTEVEVAANNLKNGHALSCGCIRSKGELKLRELLLKLDIPFVIEYSFSDLPKRRFDFALKDKNTGLIYQLIEFHGKQHYTHVSTWHQTEEEFYQAQIRDKEKEQYALSHNIPLLIIPYWDYDKLTLDYLKEKLSIEKEGSL